MMQFFNLELTKIMKHYFHRNAILCVLTMLCSCAISEIEPIEKPTEKEEIESQSDVDGPQKMMAQSDTDSLNFVKL